jgi:septum formation inhibitor MinC
VSIGAQDRETGQHHSTDAGGNTEARIACHRTEARIIGLAEPLVKGKEHHESRVTSHES